MSLSPLLAEGRRSTHSRPHIRWIKSTNYSADIDVFTLTSKPGFCICSVLVFPQFLMGSASLLLSHIWLQMTITLKNNNNNKGAKGGGNGERHANSNVTCIMFAFRQVKKEFCMCANNSLSHFNICSSSDKTSREAKLSFLFMSFEMRDGNFSKGFWKDSNRESAGISPREMD